jgi:hypothetical protein
MIRAMRKTCAASRDVALVRSSISRISTAGAKSAIATMELSNARFSRAVMPVIDRSSSRDESR